MNPGERTDHDDPPGLWWVRGLTLADRLHPAPTRDAAGELTVRRLRHWRADFADEAEGLFAARLAEVGLDEDGLRALLGEGPAALAARVPEPAWVATVRGALAAAPVTGTARTTSWDEGFAVILEPFTELAAARLAESVGGLGALRTCFTEQLGATLVRLAQRTLVLELNVRRVTGRLHGETPGQRFADYVRHAAGRPALTALLTEYAVLARLLAQACEHAVEAWAELLTRFHADRSTIVGELLGGSDPGGLVEIRQDAGDRHQGGRAVALLRFESGARLAYKPRPLAVHRHFNEVVHWLNSRLPGLDLATPKVLARPGYGWVEFAKWTPCADAAQVERFYQRLGALLALLHLLGGTDIHCENLIAVADQPVLVDLETLCHPSLAPSVLLDSDPALRALDSSVHRVALLPFLTVGEHGAVDLSGLGGDKDAVLPSEVAQWAAPATDRMRLVRGTQVFTGATNRPRLDGTDAEPDDHAEALLAGFRAGYDAIVAHRRELAGPDGLLARLAGDGTRVVVRPTARYVALLDESTHPDLLRDALDRDRLFDVLWRESAHDPVRWPLVVREVAQLWSGDVPLFESTAAARSLGETLAPPLRESGLDRARRRLAAMGGPDRQHQEWIVRASLALRRGTGAGREAGCSPVTAVPPDPQRLLAAATGLADRILAAAHDDGRRVNWLGLVENENENGHWAITSLGPGLGDGYCGIALFLARLAELTGTERYAEVAHRAVRPLPGLLSLLTDRPEHLVTVGHGGFDGLGGVAYALTHLARLLDDAELAGWAEHAVRLTATAADQADGDLLTGDVDCLVAMLAVHRATGLAQAWTTAAGCAERLAARPVGAAVPGGLVTGPAGYGWALRRFAAAGGDPHYEELGMRQLQACLVDGSATAVGRHGGLLGTALALADGGSPAGPSCDGFPAHALHLLAGGGALPDHSLRHGEAAAVELSLTAAGTDHRAGRAGHLLAELDRHGPRCGTPGGVSTPGLLTGLAGIGYQLLRVAFPARTPSVLLLRPLTG
ncbi:type 2 lanthipeptide synthetase LanM [Kitasatospora sp. NPDC052896]|uniref:type 2 lanthipeptide synthetase LanM n=1 Tax=Kitasatospora sp. NPDC052896 TaxID=3364061 RepID=UPI0037C534DB